MGPEQSPDIAEGGRKRPLISPAVRTNSTSLLLPRRLPMAEWSRIGAQIGTINESSAWWLGDWLVYGQTRFPDRYKRTIAETGLDYQTLRNYAWVARRFVPGRRRTALSFQHHAEVAGLPEDKQDEWLDCAERNQLSRNELRNRVRIARAAEPTQDGAEGEQPDDDIQLEIPPQSKQRWQSAAADAEQELLAWMLSSLDRAAHVVLAEADVPGPGAAGRSHTTRTSGT